MAPSYSGLLLVVFILFHQKATSSPVHNCPWDMFKTHSRNLNALTMKFYNATQAKDGVLLEVPRIQCQHHCGPQDLSSDEKPCLKHIHHVLSYYEKVLEVLKNDDLKIYERGEEIKEIKLEISTLLRCLEKYKDENKSIPAIEATSEFVKKRFGTPLASASSVIARVFAAGNPAHHWPKHQQ